MMPSLRILCGSLDSEVEILILEDRENFSRTAVFDDQILIENYRGYINRDIAEVLHISHMSFVKHLITLR